ncbi:hypothetical protein VPH35_060092 [Triticum aestivum]
MLEVAAVVAMEGSPPASGVPRPRDQRDCQAEFLSTGVLTSPEWMILFAFRPLGPLPMIHYIITVCGGSQVYCQQFQFNRVVAIIVRLPTGGAETALYSSRIRCPEPELSGHLQHTVLAARRWRRRRRGHGKVSRGCVLCLIFDATSSWRGGRKAGKPAAEFFSGMRGSGDAGAGEQETSHPQRRFK